MALSVLQNECEKWPTDGEFGVNECGRFNTENGTYATAILNDQKYLVFHNCPCISLTMTPPCRCPLPACPLSAFITFKLKHNDKVLTNRRSAHKTWLPKEEGAENPPTQASGVLYSVGNTSMDEISV